MHKMTNQKRKLILAQVMRLWSLAIGQFEEVQAQKRFILDIFYEQI